MLRFHIGALTLGRFSLVDTVWRIDWQWLQ